MMEGFGESVKKLLLAGIGAAATTAEKSKELLDDMVISKRRSKRM